MDKVNENNLCLRTYLMTKPNPGDICVIYEGDTIVGMCYIDRDRKSAVALPTELLAKTVTSIRLETMTYGLICGIKINVED